MAPVRVIRPIGIFVALYLLTMAVFTPAFPRLLDWFTSDCIPFDSRPWACEVAATFLQYWWMALIPILICMSAATDWYIRRRARQAILGQTGQSSSNNSLERPR